MKQVMVAFCLVSLLASFSGAEVLFSETDQVTLDFLADTTSFSSGTMIGVGYGVNSRFELSLNYASVNEGGTDVQLIMPGVRYYVLKPSPGKPWFMSVAGDYLVVNASGGSGGAEATGLFLGSILGIDLKILEGYKILPCVGFIYTKYDIGSSSVSRVNPRFGGYFGIPFGGGAVGYLKQMVTFINGQANYSASIGYHFPLK